MWTCKDGPCKGTPPTSGTLVFESPIPEYNNYGPHNWPLEPGQCYVAVLSRNTGASPPPYNLVCEGVEFVTPK